MGSLDKMCIRDRRFDRTLTSASRVSAAVMGQIEVVDLSLKEPDLSMVVKQIYQGGLKVVA